MHSAFARKMRNLQLAFALSGVLFLQCRVPIASADNSTESGSAESDSRSQSRKTYFIQLKKLLTSHEGDEKPTYVRINHSRRMRQPGGLLDDQTIEVAEENLVKKKCEQLLGGSPENMEASGEDGKVTAPLHCNGERNENGGDERNLQAKERRTSPSRIDDEWQINPNRMIYDLPNITQELYEAMLENNSFVNASMVKFFFERNSNLSSNIIKFDIEALANFSGVIIDAELHVYRLPREKNSTRPNATENVVRLYQRTEKTIDDEESSSDGNTTVRSAEIAPDVHKLANVIYISSNYEGWQVFKVKTVVDNWRSGEENLGFLISTVDAHDREDHVEFAHRQRNGGKYQPTLVVYLNQQVAPDRRSIQRRIRKPLKPIRREDFAANPCRRHVWYLSFHELGWNNFIIAPSGYMAHKCSGSCKSPIATSFTNHGKLISISERPGDTLHACCVPHSYRSLLIMFYDKESNVIIKEYEDMVVNSCGCR